MNPPVGFVSSIQCPANNCGEPIEAEWTGTQWKMPDLCMHGNQAGFFSWTQERQMVGEALAYWKDNSSPEGVMSDKYQLEDGIPMTGPARRNSSSPIVGILKVMKPGQSFILDPNINKKVPSNAFAVYSTAKETGYKYAIRRTIDGFRVWRVS